MRPEIVIRGEHSGANEFLLKNIHEIEQIFGVTVADIIYSVRRQGKSVFAVLLFGSAAHYPADALDDIVNEGEVPTALAEVEDFNLLSPAEFIGKSEIRHIRSSGGAVNGKETESGRGDIIELRIGVSQKLVAFLGGGVKGDGVVHLVLHGVRDLFVRSIHAGARRVDKMFHGMIAARLKDIIETDEVRLNIHVGMSDGVAHSRLRGEVHHHVEAVFLEYPSDKYLIGDVSADESPRHASFGSVLPAFFKESQTVFLYGYVVVVVYVVKSHYSDAGIVPHEFHCKVRSDETCGSGHEHGLIIKVNIRCYHFSKIRVSLRLRRRRYARRIFRRTRERCAGILS